MLVNSKKIIMGIAFLAIATGSAFVNSNSLRLIDSEATSETKVLFQNLKFISERGFMFGHEDDLAYGVFWREEDGRSDVKDVVGDYPAVYGWDIGKKIRHGQNIDSVRFDKMLSWIREVYERGGVNTISWHMDNLITGGDSWDNTPSVKDILPGGIKHDIFVKELDDVAEFLIKCKSGKTPVPIIFRPFHEHNGEWFWWGRNNCTEEEYIRLWRFTVDYLKDKKKINHLIYAFSPDRSRLNLNNAREEYLYGYPGDDYVDLLGLDNYWDVARKENSKSFEEQKEDFIKGLILITELAREKGKVAALTETGLERIAVTDWYTAHILEPIKNSNSPVEIAYVLVWRNANSKHHYAPYKGHPAEADFIRFYKDEKTFFESDIKNIYRANISLLSK